MVAELHLHPTCVCPKPTPDRNPQPPPQTACTNKNEQSSRSHLIVRLTVEAAPAGGEPGKCGTVSRLTLVDLAGSEGAETSDKVADSGKRLAEGSNINQSLLTLQKVFRSLTSRDRAIAPPFRDSKLTQLLKVSGDKWG